MENQMSPAVKQNDERESAEVVAVARRRKFTASYKRRIVREADACSNPGTVGALLRREGLYSSHLSNWRQEVEAAELAALQSKPRGPKPGATKAADRRVLGLELEVAKLKKQLGRAEQIIDVQKKLCDLLGLPTAGDVP
ncbi:transposase [Massilia psychrophila]|jgi:transposase-like protein|nr:transposase [Massilia psychrophila]